MAKMADMTVKVRTILPRLCDHCFCKYADDGHRICCNCDTRRKLDGDRPQRPDTWVSKPFGTGGAGGGSDLNITGVLFDDARSR